MYKLLLCVFIFNAHSTFAQDHWFRLFENSNHQILSDVTDVHVTFPNDKFVYVTYTDHNGETHTPMMGAVGKDGDELFNFHQLKSVKMTKQMVAKYGVKVCNDWESLIAILND